MNCEESEVKMKKNKNNEENKIGYALEAIEAIVNEQVETELCRVPDMEPLITALSEFGIRGMQALSFVMRFIQLNAEYQAEKED